MKRRLFAALGLITAALITAPSAHACAACYGQSDSAMAQGMNWGIMALLGVIGFVLAGLTSFFVFINRRAANPPVEPAANPVPATKF
jgi:hypothetical protein